MKDYTFTESKQNELDDIIIDLANVIQDDSPDKNYLENIYENDEYIHNCVRHFELDTDEFAYVRHGFNRRVKQLIDSLDWLQYVSA